MRSYSRDTISGFRPYVSRKMFFERKDASHERYSLGHCRGLCRRHYRAAVVAGPNNPSGFILTTVLGIAGAFLATFIGQAIGHYGPNQGAGFIAATIGALLVLFIWNRLVASRVISDPGSK